MLKHHDDVVLDLFRAMVLGRRRVLMLCVTGFTVASLLCGIATGIGEMVVFRIMQGVFGAALVPISQSLLLDVFPKEKHGQAMALWGMGIMIGPILGPPLGGWLTETYNWRYVFYINLPFGLLRGYRGGDLVARTCWPNE